MIRTRVSNVEFSSHGDTVRVSIYSNANTIQDFYPLTTQEFFQLLTQLNTFKGEFLKLKKEIKRKQIIENIEELQQQLKELEDV